MPKSRKDKTRTENVERFKEAHTPKQGQPSLLQDPSIRQYPVWSGQETIEMYGAEWEQIFNFINGVQSAYMAVNSVMNRNVLNGKIKMKFDRVNPDGTSTPLTAEEEKPYQDEFAKILAQAKQIAEHAVKQAQQPEPPSQEGLQNLNDIVDANGKPYQKEELEVPNMKS